MAYVSSNSPLPQNGSSAPPARCAAELQAAVDRARYVSISGRTVLFNTVPSMSSLAAVSPGVARSASLMLPQSELARRSVVSGAVPVSASALVGALTQPPAAVAAGPPEVVPLNWVQDTRGAGVCSNLPAAAVNVNPRPAVLMPAMLQPGSFVTAAAVIPPPPPPQVPRPAPAYVAGSWSPAPTPGYPDRGVGTWPAMGCGTIPGDSSVFTQRTFFDAWMKSLNAQAANNCGAGLNGYAAPAWGFALAPGAAADSGGGASWASNPWVWAAGLALLVGLASMNNRGR